MPDGDGEPGMVPGGTRKVQLLGLALLGLIVAWVATCRIHAALADPNFDLESPDGLLRSDPGLLYYITKEILDAGGGVPGDFRTDPRVQYPDEVDLPAMFTVGQEFLVAWTYRAFGGDMPLHVFCVWVMGIVASLAVLGVYGLAFELTRSVRWALLAAVLYALTPANYRTVGVLLIREDLSLPLFSLHLWLLARAFRRRRVAAFTGAGVALACALSTWHAMGFVVSLEVLGFYLWFLRSGRNPFEVPNAWIVPAVVAAASLVVPVLRAKLFLLSPAMAISASMLVAHAVDRRSPLRAKQKALVSLLGLAVLVSVSTWLARTTDDIQGDYGHVFSLMLAKLRYLGQLPHDPEALPFGARILWQGPFETADPVFMIQVMTVSIFAILWAAASAARGWLRGDGDSPISLMAAFGAIALVTSWLVKRTMVLPGLLGPAIAVILLARLGAGKITSVLVTLALAIQLTFFVGAVQGFRIGWYEDPQLNAEVRDLVRWTGEHLEPGAVMGDFVVSTSLLAHSRRPIVCQPKYETAESRRRIAEFYDAFWKGTPEQFHGMLRRYGCRYVLIDRKHLSEARYIGGIPLSQPGPTPGTAAATFLRTDPNVLMNVPGFHPVYRSSPPPRGIDLFRLYEIRDRR